MRQTFFLMLAGLLLLCCGCAPKPEEQEQQSQIPNPMAALEDSQREVLGKVFTLPQGIAATGRYLIAETIGQMDFCYGERAYTYRMAKAEEGDISGLYVEYEGEALGVNVDAAGCSLEAAVRFIKEGGALAQWEWDGYAFTLYTPDATDGEEMAVVVTALAEHFAAQNKG